MKPVTGKTMKRRLAGAALLLLPPVFAWAGGFDVSPVRVTLSDQHSTDEVTLRNPGTTPLTVQLQVVAWSQLKGEDVYAPSRDVVATPPIFTIPPGGQQIIRAGLRRSADAKLESSYRLYMQEISQAPQGSGAAVAFALRVGVPVFVEPAVAAKPELRWTAKVLSPTQLQLTLANSGNSHVEITSLALTSGQDAGPLAKVGAAYVLPGASHIWQVKLDRSLPDGSELRLSAESDQGTFDAQLAPER